MLRILRFAERESDLVIGQPVKSDFVSAVGLFIALEVCVGYVKGRIDSHVELAEASFLRLFVDLQTLKYQQDPKTPSC